MKKYIALIILAVLFSARAWAFLGVGDIVFDASAYSQLLQAYAQGEAQLSALGNIVGLSTEQLSNLKDINVAIGISQPGINLRDLTAGQLSALSQGLGLDVSLTLGKSYQQNGPFSGALDVFMGTTLDSFRRQVTTPWKSFADAASESALGALGAATGLSNAEINFAKKLEAMDASERRNNRVEITHGLAALGAVRFAAGGEKRRLVIQAEINLSQQASERAAKAKTVNENAAAQNEQLAAQTRMQAIAAQHQNEANEFLFQQGENANVSLAELDNRRAREELESRLAEGEDGNVY